jgi:hypothetical protein
MTPPLDPEPLDPERLARMLDDAVRPVAARADAFDRIRQRARRRRRSRRAGVALLTAAVIAGGTAAALVVIPGAGPARIGSLASSATASSTAASSATAPGAQAGPPAGQTRTAALPSAGKQAAPTAASSVGGSAPSSAARSAPPSPAQSAPSVAPSTQPSAAPSAQPSAATSTAPSAGPSVLAPASDTAPPSASRPESVVPSATSAGSWAIDGFSRPAARVTIVPVGNPKTTFHFLLVVHSTRYGTQSVPFTATYGPVIVGAANAAKDGHTELFVLVDRGCCTEFWTIFRLVSGHIVQVGLSGAPVRLAVGGSVMDNGGFSCNGQYLVTYGYANQVATPTRVTFLGTRDTYRWAGASLVLVSQRQATIRGMQNPELALYSGVSCGGLPQYEFQR